MIWVQDRRFYKYFFFYFFSVGNFFCYFILFNFGYRFLVIMMNIAWGRDYELFKNVFVFLFSNCIPHYDNWFDYIRPPRKWIFFRNNITLIRPQCSVRNHFRLSNRTFQNIYWRGSEHFHGATQPKFYIFLWTHLYLLADKLRSS